VAIDLTKFIYQEAVLCWGSHLECACADTRVPCEHTVHVGVPNRLLYWVVWCRLVTGMYTTNFLNKLLSY